jgi:hypothetical protein
MLGSGVCYYSSGCLINTTGNLTPSTLTEFEYKTDPIEKNVVCDYYDYPTCEQDAIEPITGFGVSTSFSRTFDVTCRNESRKYNVKGWFDYEHIHSQKSIHLMCRPDWGSPHVTLISPDQFAQIYEGVTFNLSCDGVDDYPLKNVTLWHNLNGSWANNRSVIISLINQEYTMQTNFSNIPIGEKYQWNCYYCDNNDYCAFASTNRSFYIVPLPIEEEDAGQLLIYLFIILVCVGIVYVFIYLSRRGQ